MTDDATPPEESGDAPPRKLSRRSLFRWGIGAGALAVGVTVPWRRVVDYLAPVGERGYLDAILAIAPDGTVTIKVGQSEMGQGVFAGLAMCVAEELRVPWEAVRVEAAPAAAAYRRPWAPDQVTAGSSSLKRLHPRMRWAGAAAREMLAAEGAARLGVARSEVEAAAGRVYRRGEGPAGAGALGYGALAAGAMARPVPAEPPLAGASQWRLIGTSPPRPDTPAKVTGEAVFGYDVRVPGMLVAAVRNEPVFGGGGTWGPRPADLPAEILGPFEVPGGVAMVAPDTWRARRAADRIEYTAPPGDGFSSAAFAARLRETVAEPGGVIAAAGEVAPALKGAARRLEALYEVPFQSHATMEPQNCTARVGDGEAEIWVPTQAPEIAQRVAAEVAGLTKTQVTVHTTYLGGGFGRRFETDLVRQAVTLAKKVERPVQVTWSREEDMRHDFYRGAYACRLEAGLDAAGRPVAWRSRSAGPSILSRVFPPVLWFKADPSSVEGLDHPYGVGARSVEYTQVDSPVPVGFWRSVGNSMNAFFVEAFLDELALAAGADPIDYRLQLLPAGHRYRAVLEALRDERKAWSATPAGRGRGVAIHESFGSVVAWALEASVADDEPRVHRAAAVVDAGRIFYPDGARAQVEGSLVFGLSAALGAEITVEGGAVTNDDFYTYPLPRMTDVPPASVRFLQTKYSPGGMGEPAVPPVLPALSNALARADGVRRRRFPLRA